MLHFNSLKCTVAAGEGLGDRFLPEECSEGGGEMQAAGVPHKLLMWVHKHYEEG